MEAPSPADTEPLVDAKVPLVDVSAGAERELTPATLDAIVASLGFGRFQLVVVTLLSVQSAVAAVETALIGYLTPCACAAWGLGYGAQTTLNAAVFVGQIAGAVALAPLADVVGRYPVVLASQLLLTLFGGLGAAASFGQLVACRFAVGSPRMHVRARARASARAAARDLFSPPPPLFSARLSLLLPR